jgi:hypothetical protein
MFSVNSLDIKKYPAFPEDKDMFDKAVRSLKLSC